MKRMIAFSALLLLTGNMFAIKAPMPGEPSIIESIIYGNSGDSDKNTDNGNSDSSCNIQ